ncbi:bifunctional UDP-N-acetylmuramoyl-tripeptide:D-alanyl-D-alanine ligase/alanine racemase, partial [bacterium]|nr:bifunctional UDP-N-acetylmuramoyl-tripeptide:D-alanyl-D-alanine ligase/alanine racemase [bacterium]
AATSLFFALVKDRRDGHSYIDDVHKQGVRNFVISKNIDDRKYVDANFLVVDDTLKALQTLASYHRKQFNIPVIGITGSNGKTIVKEWLNQLLQQDYSICRSPKSYNSQIGVPLSVWQMNDKHNLAIFEAGISTINEMQNLQQVIQPTIGILTNIGVAHNEGFENTEQKIREKLKLFKDCRQVIYCNDDVLVDELIKKTTQSDLLSWGKRASSTLQVIDVKKELTQTIIVANYQQQQIQITIPVTDDASIQNACSCWAAMLLFGINNAVIQQRMLQIHSVEMRLQLVKAINNCTLINDSYSNDFSSFLIALDYLNANAGNSKKTIIISDFGGEEKNNFSV